MEGGEKKSGQIWVETVIYTLIALTMIGAVLAFVVPRIGEIQDKSVIDQSANLMKDINNVVLSVVQGGPGNKRVIETSIRKGSLTIDGENNKIFFEMETSYLYSEPGATISLGNIKARTETQGGLNNLTLTTDYPNYNIRYNGNEVSRRIEQSQTDYIISIENKGEDAGITVVNFEVI